MVTIEASAVIAPTGELTFNLPTQPIFRPGEYKVLLVFEETPLDTPPFELPVIEVEHWDNSLSLRREDMYDDDGR